MDKLAQRLAIVRDALLILFMLIALWVGWNVVESTRDAGQIVRHPATVPLPQDRCGGGVC